MSYISEPLKPTRILPRPRKHLPLKRFSCGRLGNRWERAVNDWVQELYRGGEVEETVILLEDAKGRLTGVCGFRSERPPIKGGKLMRKAYCIHMIATDWSFRGQRLRDGSRLGDALLSGALEHIKVACGDEMPNVWALVSPENSASNALFARHGFARLPYSGEGEYVYMRVPHLRLGKQTAGSPGMSRWRALRSIGQRTRR